MVTIRGCFTQEANEEAKRILEKPSFILNIMTENNREISKEGVQTIYDLTKE